MVSGAVPVATFDIRVDAATLNRPVIAFPAPVTFPPKVKAGMVPTAEGEPSAGVTIIGVTIVQDVVIHTLPVPLTVYSPSFPALSYRTLVVDPPEITVAASVIATLDGDDPQSCSKPVVPLKQAILPATTGAVGMIELTISDVVMRRIDGVIAPLD